MDKPMFYDLDDSMVDAMIESNYIWTKEVQFGKLWNVKVFMDAPIIYH